MRASVAPSSRAAIITAIAGPPPHATKRPRSCSGYVFERLEQAVGIERFDMPGDATVQLLGGARRRNKCDRSVLPTSRIRSFATGGGQRLRERPDRLARLESHHERDDARLGKEPADERQLHFERVFALMRRGQRPDCGG